MKLFKTDTKGKLRVIELTTDGNKLIQVSGLVDGKKTTNIRECKAKNTGRANATTAEEQAERELASIVEKKLKEGYFETAEEAESTKVLLPMLATTVDISTIKYPVYVQPKLDGMRAISVNGKLISRKNRAIDTMEHIESVLETHHKFDGELYAHGLSFQENMKLIKKKRKESVRVQYLVYDIHGLDKPFSERYEQLKKGIQYLTNVHLVPTYLVNSQEELEAKHSEFISNGYEGTIIRLDSSGYEYNKRSKSLIKFKDFIDEAYTIVDIVPSDRVPTQGVVVCKLGDGTTFKCGMKVSHEEREQMLIDKDKYIGQTAEVRFFEYTDDGIPRFPVFVGVRLDK